MQSRARDLTMLALNTLRSVASSTKAQPAARVAAAVAILDRGWGKPQQDVNTKHDVVIVIRKLINGEEVLLPIEHNADALSPAEYNDGKTIEHED